MRFCFSHKYSICRLTIGLNPLCNLVVSILHEVWMMVTWEHLEIPPAHTTRCPSQSSSLHSCWPQPCHHFPSHKTCTRWFPWAAHSANHPPARTGALHHRWCPQWSEALGYPGKGPQGKLLLSPSSMWLVGCGWMNSWKLFGTFKSDHLPKCKIHQKPAFHPWFSTTSHPPKKKAPTCPNQLSSCTGQKIWAFFKFS